MGLSAGATPLVDSSTTKSATCPRSIFLFFFANTLPECAFASNGGPADAGAVLSNAITVESDDIGQCFPTGNAITLSYSYFGYGNVKSCSVLAYASDNCSGSGKTSVVTSTTGQCQEGNIKSFKLTCPS